MCTRGQLHLTLATADNTEVGVGASTCDTDAFIITLAHYAMPLRPACHIRGAFVVSVLHW